VAPTENEAIVRRIFDAFARKEGLALRGLFAEDAVWSVPGRGIMHVAGGDMHRIAQQFRRALHADRLGERAACVEATAGGRIDRIGRVAGDRRLLDTTRGIHRRL